MKTNIEQPSGLAPHEIEGLEALVYSKGLPAVLVELAQIAADKGSHTTIHPESKLAGLWKTAQWHMEFSFRELEPLSSARICNPEHLSKLFGKFAP